MFEHVHLDVSSITILTIIRIFDYMNFWCETRIWSAKPPFTSEIHKKL